MVTPLYLWFGHKLNTCRIRNEVSAGTQPSVKRNANANPCPMHCRMGAQRLGCQCRGWAPHMVFFTSPPTVAWSGHTNHSFVQVPVTIAQDDTAASCRPPATQLSLPCKHL